MNKFIIRNDDVAFDTRLTEIQRFCEICDRYGNQIIHAIIPIGEARKIKSKMSNDQIRAISSKLFSENKEVIDYLLTRNDLIGVHGLWHTHSPTKEEIKNAKHILEGLGFHPTHFVPPFNEGNYPPAICDLFTCSLSSDKGENLEDFIEAKTPTSPIMYLHSWRFDDTWYSFDQLEQCLKRINNASLGKDDTAVKLNLGSKYRKLPGFENLDKLFGWYFQDGLPQYEPESVDAITISHALMFLTESELTSFAKEMYRVIKPGGVVRITEDDTENPESRWYQTGNVGSGPQCLTGPKMMRAVLEKTGFDVHDVSHNTTHFEDNSLIQAYRGATPDYFFIEGIK